MKIPWIFHKDYDIPLPKNHRFSSSKFGDLYTLLIDSELAKYAEVFVPNAAKDSQLTEVHTRDYISKIKNGNLSYKEEKILGLPWSETLSKRSHLAVNGTYLTAKLALINGIACQASICRKLKNLLTIDLQQAFFHRTQPNTAFAIFECSKNPTARILGQLTPIIFEEAFCIAYPKIPLPIFQ